MREGSGAGSDRQVPGGSGKLPGEAPNDRFREGSGADGFREGSWAGSERQVPGRFRTTFRNTGSGKVPGQVLIHEFREVSGAGSGGTGFRLDGSRRFFSTCRQNCLYTTGRENIFLRRKG